MLYVIIVNEKLTACFNLLILLLYMKFWYIYSINGYPVAMNIQWLYNWVFVLIIKLLTKEKCILRFLRIEIIHRIGKPRDVFKKDTTHPRLSFIDTKRQKNVKNVTIHRVSTITLKVRSWNEMRLLIKPLFAIAKLKNNLFYSNSRRRFSISTWKTWSQSMPHHE